jgi:hypothetical protein
MYFPTLFAFAGHYFCFVIPISFFIFGIIGVLTAVQDRRIGRKPYVDEKSRLFAIGACILGGFMMIFLVFTVMNYFTQRIELQRIAEIRIERIRHQNGPMVGEPVILNDPALFLDGMKTLGTADPHLRGKGEYFSDGYRILIRYEGDSSYLPTALYAYRRSSMQSISSHIVLLSDARTVVPDAYDCKAFHEWLGSFGQFGNV